MFAYVDPNWFGLPLQAAPWLIALFGAAGGAGLALLLRSWRSICRLVCRHWLLFAGALLVMACLAAIAWGLRRPSSRPSSGEKTVSWQGTSKVLVLGMDGLDPDVLKALMDAGELPAFQQLAKGGSFARLATTTPPQSPVVWSSFATGLDAGGHGIFDFILRDPARYGLDLSITSAAAGGGYVNRRKGRAFWGELSELGVPVSVLFSPCEFPPVPLRGACLSGMGTPDLQGTMGRYTLISTDPRWAERDLSGRLIGTAFTRDDVTFSLPGARLRSATRHKDLSVDVRLHRAAGRDGVVLAVQGQEISLDVGQWSPWVRLRFSAGLLRSVRGICRFHLVSLKPELNLYCTAVQFDPAEPVFPISHPPGFAAELAENVGLFATLGMPLDTKALEEGVLSEGGF